MKVRDAQHSALARRGTRGRPARARCRAFTLLELLVTVAIIGVLVSLLLPALLSAVGIARARQCQFAQRSVAFDFSIFADDTVHPYRGQGSPSNQFRLASFIDAQYQIGDFWSWGDVNEIEVPDGDGHDPMRCPLITGPITLFRGRQAFAGGVGPADRISYGFNVRLHQVEVINSSGQPQARRISLSSAVLSASNVPLMWDIDPIAATDRGMNPVLSGPSLGNDGIFGGDRYWFPAQRHRGNGIFVFIDGHVEESANPLAENWDWGYAPLAR